MGLGVWQVGVYLRTHPVTVTYTYNAANKLGRKGMEALAPALRHLKQLQKLYLDSTNQIYFCGRILASCSCTWNIRTVTFLLSNFT